MKKDKDSISKVNNEQVTRAREKEAIFINRTNLDEASINKFYKFYKFRIKRFDFYSFLVCGLIMIIIAICYLLKWDNYFLGLFWNILINIIFIILGISFWVSAFKSQKYDRKAMKKIYDEDVCDLKNIYYFNENGIIIVNKYGETERVYSYLESIYEAKDFYYIFTAKKNAHIVKKDSFVKGTENDFNTFIKKKLGKNFKKRCIRKKEEVD